MRLLLHKATLPMIEPYTEEASIEIKNVESIRRMMTADAEVWRLRFNRTDDADTAREMLSCCPFDPYTVDMYCTRYGTVRVGEDQYNVIEIDRRRR